MADTCSPTTTAQWTTDLSLMSPVQGPSQLTPPRAGAPGVVDGCTTPSDATPTLREATRRLAWFTEEVQLKRMSPLIASPPRQKVATTRQPLPQRSRRIAAQPLAHIPTSKRSEVLLMQRMGFASPGARISSASKRAYVDLFVENLTCCSRRPMLGLVEDSSRMMEKGRAASSGDVQLRWLLRCT